ncbi:MAG: rhomboid family intramembrane serine protease [bacterium]
MLQRTFLKPGGNPLTGVRILLVGYLLAMLAFVFWGSRLYPDTLGLVPSRAFGGYELWRLVSSLVYFGTLEAIYIAPFLLGLFALWLLGSPLEGWLGTKRFLILFFTCALAGHLGAGLTGLALAPHQAVGGASPGVWGVIVALGLLYWNVQVYLVRPLPVRGKHLLIALGALFAIAALLDVFEKLPLLPSLASLIGGGVGALFVTRSWRPSQLFGKRRQQSRFVVLQGGRDPLPRASSPAGGRAGNGGGHSDDAPNPPKKLWN